MGRYQEATARQLDFESGVPFTPISSAERLRPARLCVVCGRHPVHLMVTQQRGHQAAKVCLRCHLAVMRQRKMLRLLPASSRHATSDLGLIVPRDSHLSPEARTARLEYQRRRAQVACKRRA